MDTDLFGDVSLNETQSMAVLLWNLLMGKWRLENIINSYHWMTQILGRIIPVNRVEYVNWIKLIFTINKIRFRSNLTSFFVRTYDI